MSTTMLPFLYQTRTLSGMSWKSARSRHPTLSRHISSSLRTLNSPEAVTWKPSAAPEEPPEPHLNISRTSEQHTNSRTPERPSSKRNTEFHGSPRPSEYTRQGSRTSKTGFAGRGSSAIKDYKPDRIHFTKFDTSLIDEDKYYNQSPNLIKKYWDKHFEARKDAEAEFSVRPEDNIAFEDSGFDSSMAQDEIQSLTSRSQPRESTITDSERHAFQRIFESILKRESGTGNAQAKPSWDESVVGAGGEGKEQPHDFLENSAHESKTLAEIKEAIKRYPPALRPAAERAFRVVDKAEMPGRAQQLAQSSEARRIHLAERLHKIREPERIRVGDLMRAAKTDFELWEILEQEVFPLIKTLGLEEKKPEENIVVTKKKKKNKKTKSQENAKSEETEIGQVPKEKEPETLPLYLASMGEALGVSPVAVYAPLYSEHLLFALRMLDRAFSKPSPLALSILPKLKSLGLISHILGGSTQFYNELMRIHALRLDDFRGMLKLLEEMENAAVDFDEGTLEVVNETLKSHDDARQGHSGEAVKALWGMPEYEYSRLRKWKEQISETVKERELERKSRFEYNKPEEV